MTFYDPLTNLINQLKCNLGFPSQTFPVPPSTYYRQQKLWNILQPIKSWPHAGYRRYFCCSWTRARTVFHWVRQLRHLSCDSGHRKTHSNANQSQPEPGEPTRESNLLFVTANKILHNNLNGTIVAVLCEIIAGTMNDRFCSCRQHKYTRGRFIATAAGASGPAGWLAVQRNYESTCT